MFLLVEEHFANSPLHVCVSWKVTEKDCTEIVEACIDSGIMLTVCHVLRYDPLIHKIKVDLHAAYLTVVFQICIES